MENIVAMSGHSRSVRIRKLVLRIEKMCYLCINVQMKLGKIIILWQKLDSR